MARRAYRNNFLRHSLRSWRIGGHLWQESFRWPFRKVESIPLVGGGAPGGNEEGEALLRPLELINMLESMLQLACQCQTVLCVSDSSAAAVDIAKSRYSRSITTGVAERLMHFDLE